MLALSACQHDLVLDADVPEAPAELVVNALFQPDSTWTVHVNSSTPLLGLAKPEAIENATVELFEGNHLVEVLPFDRTLFLQTIMFEDAIASEGGTVARYRSLAERPEAGSTYRIRVAAPGFTTVEGISRIPSQVRISEATYLPNVGQNEIGPLAEIRLSFADPVNEANYYNIRLHNRGFDKQTQLATSLSYGFSVISDLQDDFFGADPDDFLGEDEPFEVKEDGITFSDAFFDGETKEVVLQLRGGAACGSTTQPNDRFVCQTVVELTSISEEFYRYHRTLQLQNETRENPFAERVAIQSNLTNGLGVFAGYRTDVWIHERPLNALDQ